METDLTRGLQMSLRDIEARIQAACDRSGRQREAIRLIGVTKTHEAEVINASIVCGITDIGENRVQEIMRKYDAVTPGVQWHLIGHLQTNKVKYIVDKVDLIHSVDRLPLALEINKRAEQAGKVMPVLIQINVADEASKFGIAPELAGRLLEEISELPYVRVMGLMNIAPFVENPEDVREDFRKMKEIFDEFSKMSYDNIEMKYLSMGMSNDFEIAVEEGANMLRIGSILYGARPVATN